MKWFDKTEPFDPANLSHHCRTDSGRTLRAGPVLLREAGPLGQQRVVKVFERFVEDHRWQELRPRVTIGSFVLSVLACHWPPESVDRLYLEDGCICLEFRDPWVPFEKPILPFGWDQESQWLARFREAGRRWSLTRLRKLDYENTDRPV